MGEVLDFFLVDEHPTARLVVSGRLVSDPEPTLRRLALRDAVDFLGWVAPDRLPAVLAADWREGMGASLRAGLAAAGPTAVGRRRAGLSEGQPLRSLRVQSG